MPPEYRDPLLTAWCQETFAGLIFFPMRAFGPLAAKPRDLRPASARIMRRTPQRRIDTEVV